MSKCLYCADEVPEGRSVCPSCYSYLSGGNREINCIGVLPTYWLGKELTGTRRRLFGVERFTTHIYLCTNCGNISDYGAEKYCPKCHTHISGKIEG